MAYEEDSEASKIHLAAKMIKRKRYDRPSPSYLKTLSYFLEKLQEWIHNTYNGDQLRVTFNWEDYSLNKLIVSYSGNRKNSD